MILVLGATGRLGRAVSLRLLEQGIPFRGACRDVTKAQDLIARGVEIVPLDIARRDGFEAALTRVTKMLSCVHGLLGRSRHSIQRIDVDGHAALIDAAVQAGVERFVYMSALGAAPDHPSEFWRAKARTEQYLKASGLNHVILRPAAFLDLYAHDMIGAAVLRGKTVFLLGDGETRRNLIAVADVADAAIAALLREDLAGQTIEFGGPDNPTEKEVAALYARLSGRPCKVRHVPPSALRILSKTIAPFHSGVGHLLRLPLMLAGRQDLRLDPSSSSAQIGLNPSSLQDYIESRLSAQAPEAS